MKICKFISEKKIYYGSIINNGKKVKIINNPFKKEKINKKRLFDINNIRLLSPINPSKIICVALNFKGISNFDKKKDPLFFIKSSNAITINEKIKIVLNRKVWCEPEIGIVIKNKINRNSINIENKILGYNIANDLTAENYYGRDHHLFLSKSIDNYCPISKYITTNFNFNNKLIEGYHNDVLLRKGNTKNIFWDPLRIIKYLSQHITFNPEDLILTGSPPRLIDRKYVRKGDKFQIKIQELGELNNYFL